MVAPTAAPTGVATAVAAATQVLVCALALPAVTKVAPYVASRPDHCSLANAATSAAASGSFYPALHFVGPSHPSWAQMMTVASGRQPARHPTLPCRQSFADENLFADATPSLVYASMAHAHASLLLLAPPLAVHRPCHLLLMPAGLAAAAAASSETRGIAAVVAA